MLIPTINRRESIHAAKSIQNSKLYNVEIQTISDESYKIKEDFFVKVVNKVTISSDAFCDVDSIR